MSNELVNALLTIKNRFGKETLADSKRMNGLLADLLPTSSIDRKIVIRIIDEGIMQEFLENGNERGFGRLKNYFYNEEYMRPERAEYYLDVFATLFDYDRKKESDILIKHEAESSETHSIDIAEGFGQHIEKNNNRNDGNTGKTAKYVITGILACIVAFCLGGLVIRKMSVTGNQGTTVLDVTSSASTVTIILTATPEPEKTPTAKPTSTTSPTPTPTLTPTPTPTLTPTPSPTPIPTDEPVEQMEQETELTVIHGIRDPSTNSDIYIPGATESSYLWPDADKRYYSESDLDGLTQGQVRYLINEIYARAGYTFNNNIWAGYFSKKTWYRATVSNANFTASPKSYLNEYEYQNVEMINHYQTAHGYQEYT